MESSSIICTPIAKQPRIKQKGIKELVNLVYFKGIVGSLCYLTSTRPNITYGVGIISLFIEKLYQSYLQATKQILRYVVLLVIMEFFALTKATLV